MPHRVVTLQFSREGESEALDLDPGRTYQVRVDGGPPGTFSPPWTQEELEDRVETLRNKGDERPTAELLKQLGRSLGEALHAVDGVEAALARRRPDEHVTVYWAFDYPELSRVPWELATRNQAPYRHLLDDGVSFVRRVPSLIQDPPVTWPTGRNVSLRLLFAWGQGEGERAAVPHDRHREELERICGACGVELDVHEVATAEELGELCNRGDEPYHFVHLLAHGAARDGVWGLRLSGQVARPELIARALHAGGQGPAVVTVSACDSADERDNSFGSVAYQLHAYGVPFVLASQFRLRKPVSVLSVTRVYEELLSGGDLREVLSGLRRQLAVRDDEAWANEVLYTRYRYESLEELAVVARQQGALRRANAIERRARKATPEQAPALIEELEHEHDRLQGLVESLDRDESKRAAVAETYGLLGSLRRRMARLRSDPPDPEDLRDARAAYEQGMLADANSHYCGINVVHLSRLVGDDRKVEEFLEPVRFTARAQMQDDFWALATAADLEIYAHRPDEAAELYREFVRRAAKKARGKEARERVLLSPKRPLEDLLREFADDEAICTGARACLDVIEAALRRNR
ncbi:MAG: CHAT domain-containing protein [Planctomycetota bacterium]